MNKKDQSYIAKVRVCLVRENTRSKPIVISSVKYPVFKQVVFVLGNC